MTKTTAHQDVRAAERDLIAQLANDAASPEALSRAGVLALLHIADLLGDVAIEIADLPASM